MDQTVPHSRYSNTVGGATLDVPLVLFKIILKKGSVATV